MATTVCVLSRPTTAGAEFHTFSTFSRSSLFTCMPKFVVRARCSDMGRCWVLGFCSSTRNSSRLPATPVQGLQATKSEIDLYSLLLPPVVWQSLDDTVCSHS